MIALIDDYRESHGVEPICKVLPIAASTYLFLSQTQSGWRLIENWAMLLPDVGFVQTDLWNGDRPAAVAS